MSAKKYLLTGIILILILGIALSYSTPQDIDNNNALYQVYTLNLLSAGDFDGNFSTGELKNMEI